MRMPWFEQSCRTEFEQLTFVMNQNIISHDNGTGFNSSVSYVRSNNCVHENFACLKIQNHLSLTEKFTIYILLLMLSINYSV